MSKYTRRAFLEGMGKAAAWGEALRLSWTPLPAKAPGWPTLMWETAPRAQFGNLKDGWRNPARSFRPHTRWWWPGSDVTKEGIAQELDEMRRQGMGGVEIMSPWRMYTEGNISYLSRQFLDMVQYAIQQASLRDMEVAVTFGAGWTFGGFWVPPTQRSKVLTQSWEDVSGPGVFDRELPKYTPAESSPSSPAFHPEQARSFLSDAPDENQIVAVVAGKVAGGGLDPDSLAELTNRVRGNHLRWTIPEGQWRIMTFRLKYTGEQNDATENFLRREWVVDHFNKEAVKNYCDYLGGAFYQAFGGEFGKTLDTFFCDSFEVLVLPGTIHWSNAALDEFRAYKGYGLARYLPAIWWSIGNLTPKVRYDVNDFLGRLGLDATFMSFIDWCGKHGAQARIQPHYRFTEELIEGAGVTPRPEMEVSTARFAVVTDPRKAIAAGAHLYGREIVSAEAYTFLHPQRYLTTMEEMKIATDAFLRDGVTQFYNHGYIYSPEAQVAPSRDMPWANRISPWNPWWKYYHLLSAYVSRCCFLLRQGEFAADVLIYSPQSMVWSETVLFENRRRMMPYGDVGQTLVANGYDFDPVNDDVLQNRARADRGHIAVRGLAYRVLILPGIAAAPVATMEFIRRFVLGGGIVVALGMLPRASVGLPDYEKQDARVQEIVSEIFGSDGKGKAHPGGGRTYAVPEYPIPDYETAERAFNPGDQRYRPMPPVTPPQQVMLRALRENLEPDFTLAGNRQSNGLTFLHRRLGADDLYFVTNLQPEASRTPVTFRVQDRIPECWDPMTGEIRPVFVYDTHIEGIEIPIDLPPYASRCFLFRSRPPRMHLSESNLDEVRELTGEEVRGVVSSNGEARITVVESGRRRQLRTTVSGLPSPLPVGGAWRVTLEGFGFAKMERQVERLSSWTDDPETRYFSGTGRYLLDFHAPDEYVSPDLEVALDLGHVGEVAEVILNGKPAGVAWMRPYRLDITAALTIGANRLEILVTNRLMNRVSGMDRLPETPAALMPHYGPTAHSYDKGTAEWERLEKGFHPLPPSGLMGPVFLIPRRKVNLPLALARA